MAETAFDTIGDYAVLEKLGEGGMGSVFKARHKATGKIVAIKLTSDHVRKNPVLMKRFELEYRATQGLKHPHIVEAIEMGEVDGRPYLVMEFVSGRSLWTIIEDDGPLSEAEAVRLIAQIGHALQGAHNQGIIHRDVKPENILVTQEGEAKLVDLGLVKDLDSDQDLTRTRRGLGTPNFMAPEQFRDAKHADVRCDVYSLGATLYMALTGEMPFPDKAIAKVLRAKMCDDLIPPRTKVRSLSEHVDRTVRRSLRADPKDRQESCLEFIRELTKQSPALGKNGTPMARREPARPAPSPGSAASIERRAWVRFPCKIDTACKVHVSIHESDAELEESWAATVEDLSAKGVGLHVSRRFEPRTLLRIHLESRNRTFSRDLELRVTRIARSGAKGWFVGGQFTEQLSKDDLRKLV